MKDNHPGIKKQVIKEQGESQTKDILKIEKQNLLTNVFYQNYQISINNTHVLIVKIFQLFYIFHGIIIHQLMNDKNDNIVKQCYLVISQNQLIILLFQLVMYLNKLFLIVCLYLSKKGKRENRSVSSLGKKIINLAYILIEVDFILSSFIIILNFQQNIVCYLLSALISIYSNICLQDYVNRKCLLYCSSQKSSLIFRGLIITILLSNSVFFYIQSLTCFMLSECILGMVLLVWYLFYGKKLYIHSTSNHFLLLLISFNTSMLLVALESKLMGKMTISSLSIFKLSFSFFVITLFLYIYTHPYQLNLEDAEYQKQFTIKEIQLFMNSVISNYGSDTDKQVYCVGIFHLHQNILCKNDQCPMRKSDIYDAVLKEKVQIEDTKRDKQSRVRFYIKCLYKMAMKEKKRTSTAIDYCEFICSECDNVFALCQLFHRLEHQQLGFLDKLRFYKIKLLAKQQSDYLNKNLFEGKLQLEAIITAEQHFQNVTHYVDQFINKHLQIWAAVKSDSVCFSQLRMEIGQSFRLIQEANNQWLHISKYLEMNRRWKQYYLNYSLFLRNEKVKHKDLQRLYCGDSNSFFNNYSPRNRSLKNHKNLQFDQNLLFDANSFSLKAYSENDKLYISRVSSYFTAITGYTEEEVKGCQLNTILNNELKLSHDSIVSKWLQDGYSINEDSYSIKLTECVSKLNKPIQVTTFFKLFIDLNSPEILQFVCLVHKSNILTEDSYQSTIKLIQINSTNQQQKIKTNERSTKCQNNIFLKELHFQPNQKIQQISFIKLSMRIVVVLTLVILLSFLFTVNTDAQHLNSYSYQYLSFLNLYRYPMSLVKNYLKYYLNLGTQSKVVSQIQSATSQYIGFIQSSSTMLTLFDQNLNPSGMYYPFRNNSINRGIGYNQIDIFYVIAASISSLSIMPLNRTGHDFVQLNQYLKPSYDIMINTTKYKLHQYFEDIFTLMETKQIIFSLFQSGLLLAVTVFVSIQSYLYFRKMKELLLTIVQFNTVDINKILNYWRTLDSLFKNTKQDHKYCQDQANIKRSKKQALNGEQQHEDNAVLEEATTNMNKRNKNIQQHDQQQNRTNKLIKIFALSMILILAIFLSIEVTNFISISNLHSFQLAGFYFTQYFPATSTLGHALLDKYYSYVYPKENTYYPERFADALEDMRLIGQYSYIGSIDLSSQYYLKQKNYLFGNPCTYNPAVLVLANATMTQCLTISNSTFPNGISTFIRFGYAQVSGYLSGKANLTTSVLSDLTTSLSISNYYFQDAIQTWTDEFSQRILNLQILNTYLCICLCIFIVVLYIALGECVLFKLLQQDYDFNRKIFKSMIPEYILINQKVTKQKFVILGILNNT